MKRQLPDRSLLGWLREPGSGRGIRFAGAGEAWDYWGYDRLARLVHRTACGLLEAGVRRGDVVVIVQRSGPGFVGSFFGTLVAGATPCPVAPPMAFGDPIAYRAHLTGVLGTLPPALVVTEPDLVAELGSLVAAAAAEAPRSGPGDRRAGGMGTRVRPVDELLAGVPDPARPPGREPADLALIQFTSGSSGRARGVTVPRPALEANLVAISEWLHHTSHDATATWLPVHHDMGLIGTLLTPVVNGADIWLMPPEEFVRRPLRYLRCFGEHGARLTAMPNFGLHHIVRRVRPEHLSGLDFRAWRAVIVGAERIDAATLERFAALLGPHGLSPRALCPAYGLAEATLLVTGLSLEEPWRAISVDPDRQTVGARVEPDPQPPDGGRHRPGAGRAVVGCGRPVGEVAVTVVDGDGNDLPAGHVGEIVVRGASVTPGYLSRAGSAGLTRLVGDRLYSGDAGFICDAQLYVLGRLGDAIKIRGKAVFAEDLEAALVGPGMPAHRLAVALGTHRGESTAVVVAEEPVDDRFEPAVEVLRGRLGSVELVVIRAARGTIPRTSSGKPKRRQLWSAFVHGSLRRRDGDDSTAARRAA